MGLVEREAIVDNAFRETVDNYLLEVETVDSYFWRAKRLRVREELPADRPAWMQGVRDDFEYKNNLVQKTCVDAGVSPEEPNWALSMWS